MSIVYLSGATPSRTICSKTSNASGMSFLAACAHKENNVLYERTVGIILERIISSHTRKTLSKSTAEIIREIESSYGAAKICGGGGKKGPAGVLLCYHPTPKILEKIAKSHNLDYFKTALGVEGLRKEK